MIVGVNTLELHLPAAGSLKQKRQVVRSLKERLRGRFNVALIEESEFADVWQRASLALVSVSESREALERLFDSIRSEAESRVPGHVVDGGRDYMEMETGLGAGWVDDEDDEH